MTESKENKNFLRISGIPDQILSEQQARQYSPLTLAFLGDSVYELMIRRAMIVQGNRAVRNLHDAKIRLVCASYQAAVSDQLIFTEQEQSVFQRGRNAVTANSIPRSAKPADYRKATGLEAVFGYLYLSGNSRRLRELSGQIWNMQEEIFKNY
ncbi:MAG: ribonuclease III [Oscillospiraceae bacterium]|nr:ribonuclease III [Oscillospiraceae bacterium]MDE5885880.1 ribonuclease III [Oscillospiraceae bacterium]